MEGVGDQTFRKAIATIGGFDEAVTEFISVPAKAHVESLVRSYDKNELGSIPLAAQIMGADPLLMAATAVALENKGAPRIDINCGCPSNTVTGRGAGSSLLRNPMYLYEIASSVVQAVSIPVSLKMRSGYENSSLLEENLRAAEESGVCFITLHPRTKVEGYTPPARWDLIAKAKEILHIPLIGNGDITSVEKALQLLEQTHCDALMIGRGALTNPFLFHQIKAHFAQEPYSPPQEALANYLHSFIAGFPPSLAKKNKVNKLKQLLSFLFKLSPPLLEQRQLMLTSQFEEAEAFLAAMLPVLKKNFLS